MKRLQVFICFVLCCSITNSLIGQNRLILNDDIFIVIDNSAFVVLENSNPNAITTLGQGGNISSEDEFDVIQWEIGTTTGTYIIPWTTNSGTKIPLTISKTTAGSGSNAKFILSTWECATDMNNPWPTGIASMNFNGVDKSLFVADRYWHIDARSYVSKPSINMIMKYDPAPNEIGGSNTIIESNLVAQRFNTSINHWETGSLFGTNDALNDQVLSINVGPNDFFEDWILVDNSNPLPVTLTHFEAQCDEGEIQISWETATEINNDYFSLEKSYDGSNFVELTRISGHGNSITPINYAYVDDDFYNGPIYYRLKQVDFDGGFEYFDVVSVSCSPSTFEVNHVSFNKNDLTFEIQTNERQMVNIYLFDNIGRLISTDQFIVEQGVHPFTLSNLNLSAGMYFLSVEGQHELINQKITTTND